ncbi:hypothetical protein [Haloarchaeobius sp. DFWS5]|uniref:hypothetical protein n=1 Tax=Haloarchaeobius sp. DFWS5 TaxID=3446114 RepID=UPI003EBA2A09
MTSTATPADAVRPRVDVLRVPDTDDGQDTSYLAVPAGDGRPRVDAARDEAGRRLGASRFARWVAVPAGLCILGTVVTFGLALPWWAAFVPVTAYPSVLWWFDFDDPFDSVPDLVAVDCSVADASERFEPLELDDSVGVERAAEEPARAAGADEQAELD